jgi:hypothetical protein
VLGDTLTISPLPSDYFFFLSRLFYGCAHHITYKECILVMRSENTSGNNVFWLTSRGASTELVHRYPTPKS